MCNAIGSPTYAAYRKYYKFTRFLRNNRLPIYLLIDIMDDQFPPLDFGVIRRVLGYLTLVSDFIFCIDFAICKSVGSYWQLKVERSGNHIHMTTHTLSLHYT